MAIGQPDKNTMLLSLLSRQRRAATGRYGRLPTSRYSRPNPMLGPEMSDSDIMGDLTPSPPPKPEMSEQSMSVGDAPAPTTQGVGIGPLAGLAKGAVIPALGNVAFGLSNPLFGKVALAKLVYNSIQAVRNPDITMTEDEAFAYLDKDFEVPEDIDPVIANEEDPDPETDLDAIQQDFQDINEEIGVPGSGGSGGNVGGSASPGGFGGPMGGGGQEGDTGASNTGTVGSGEGDGK